MAGRMSWTSGGGGRTSDPVIERGFGERRRFAPIGGVGAVLGRWNLARTKRAQLRSVPVPALPAPMSNATPPPANPPAETPLWSGHPSQWLHVGFYLFCLVLAAAAVVAMPYTDNLSIYALGVPVVMILIRWWLTRATRYELTSQRLKVRRGILSRRLDELELYRVKDYVLEQPLLLRMVGRGHLTLVTSDASTRTVVLRGIPDVEAVREKLRTAVQAERDRKQVRELDVEDPNPLT
jgi:membrane protein YdbS with pleckstrin-like domain